MIVCIFCLRSALNEVATWVHSATAAGLAQALEQFRGSGIQTSGLLICVEFTDDFDEKAATLYAADLLRALPGDGLFLNSSAQDLLRTSSSADLIVEDFGVYNAEGWDRAERIYAAFHPDVPHAERPYKQVAGNCPRLERSFIGRESAIARLEDLVTTRRLTVVTGPAGVGKTSLALRVTKTVVDEFPDGIWWFKVSECASLEQLLGLIRKEPQLSGITQMAEIGSFNARLASREALLVLDGCEHLESEIAAFCEDLLSAGTGLTLVLTSSSWMDVAGGHLLDLEPLETGDEQTPHDELALLECEALALLYERAEEYGVLLPLDEASIGLALELCRCLDGLPFAIEICASSLRHAGLESLIAAVSHASPRSGVMDPAAKALDNYFVWIFGLLSDHEKGLIGELALYEGSWTLGTISGSPESGGEDLGYLHQQLLRRSLVTCDLEDESYRLLRPFRDFVRRQHSLPMKKHLERLVGVLAGWSASIYLPEPQAAERQLQRHYRDFVKALELAGIDESLREFGRPLLQSLIPYWSRRNLFEDAQRLCLAALGWGEELDRVRAFMMLGIATWRRRKLDEAQAWFTSALKESRRIEFAVGEAAALSNRAMAFTDAGHHTEAVADHERAVAIVAESHDDRRYANCLCNLAQGALSAASAAGPEDRIALTIRAERALEKVHSLNVVDPVLIQARLSNEGRLAMILGDSRLAKRRYRQAIVVCEENSLPHEAFEALLALANLSLAAHEPQAAAKLVGLAIQVVRRAGHAPADENLVRVGTILRELRQELGSDRCDSLQKYGSKLQLGEIERFAEV